MNGFKTGDMKGDFKGACVNTLLTTDNETNSDFV